MQTSPSPSLSSDAEDSAYCDYTILTGLFQYILQRLHYEIYPPYIINYKDSSNGKIEPKHNRMCQYYRIPIYYRRLPTKGKSHKAAN